MKIPEIDGRNCVHALIKNASCRACVDVCPARACHLAGDKPFIDSVGCDDCGLCSAVCSEGCIQHYHEPGLVSWQEQKLAVISCEFASSEKTAVPTGHISCIHALGIRDLLSLHATGYRRLLVSTGTCSDCSRGTADLFAERLAALNSLFLSRDEPKLECAEIEQNRLSKLLRVAEGKSVDKKNRRFDFLRRASREAGVSRAPLPTAVSDVSLSRVAPAKLLPDKGAGQVLPLVPHIDVDCCVACDTCIKLCPHEALGMTRVGEGTFYAVDAKNCTGCGICEDVCEHKAIEIRKNTTASARLLSLVRRRCEKCRHEFNSLETSPASCCLICQQKDQQPSLFQVLD